MGERRQHGAGNQPGYYWVKVPPGVGAESSGNRVPVGGDGRRSRLGRVHSDRGYPEMRRRKIGQSQSLPGWCWRQGNENSPQYTSSRRVSRKVPGRKRPGADARWPTATIAHRTGESVRCWASILGGVRKGVGGWCVPDGGGGVKCNLGGDLKGVACQDSLLKTRREDVPS